ncbi:MAG: hypothetical protein LRY73_18110 [Bacillus sp. (in: Bacteria)]|nr:hypothetical protein [Bacillus sp. (in: firmicutes)]
MSDTPKKKISLQDAIKQQLENKKNKAADGNKGGFSNQTKQMKSQQSKKTMNTRRKMGG